MVYYWNQEYFEGLKEIGEAYAQRKGYELFGEYCLQKELGLKKRANQTSLKFVNRLQQQSISHRRNAVMQLCELDQCNPEVHSLINHHLAILIQTTLFEWSESEPSSAVSHRWEAIYGRYDRKGHALEKALKLAPDDQMIIIRKCSLLAYELEHMVHHLNQNIMLGDEADARAILAELQKLCGRISQSEQSGHFESELSYYTELFELWEQYHVDGIERGFVEWAKDTADFDW
ncbi:MAG: hypothetical protein AAF950_07070 [Pseudomonadota bacterium]